MLSLDKKPEILAPAGNIESLKCAIHNGADAVYLGIKNFNARAKAANFSYDELGDALEFAHFYGVKVYVTFNTLYKDDEYASVEQSIKECSDLGVDAFIMQDFAFISHIKSTIPDIIIHLSTQAGVHNLQGALAAEKLGVQRVILSREALLSDIIDICSNTSLEVECFVQGALCISFSGNCYFSSLASGYSGNRGKCMQLCRKKYTFENKTGYWLSPKDINLSENLDKLIAAGVASLKIEGRMRRPEYVGEAVYCYRCALDKIPYDKSRIAKMFNRGNYTKAYIDNPKNDVIYHQSQNHIGYRVGKVLGIKNNVALTSHLFQKGDGVRFISKGIETGSALISKAQNQTTFTGKVHAGDDVYITTDSKLNDEVLAKRRYVDFDLQVTVTAEQASFTVASGKNSACIAISDIVAAKNSPFSIEDATSSFKKCADLGFRLNNVTSDIRYSIFMPKSAINEVRRNILLQLKKTILGNYKIQQSEKLHCNLFETYCNLFETSSYLQTSEKCVIMQTDNVDIANTCADFCDYVAYFPKMWSEKTPQEIEAIKKPVLLSLPNVARGNDIKVIKNVVEKSNVEAVVVNNLYGFKIAEGKKILLGPLLNIVNNGFPYPKVLSVEAKNTHSDNFVYYYGNFPIMTFCHCPVMSFNGKCLHCSSDYSKTIVDEKNNVFPLYPYRISNCYCYLQNCVPVNLSGVNIKSNKLFIDTIGLDKESCCKIMHDVNLNTKIIGGTKAFYNKNLE